MVPSAVRLADLDVLVLDCQATAAAPRGHPIEIGWARTGRSIGSGAEGLLINLPAGARIAPAVARLTGISERMCHDGVDARVAWRKVADAAAGLAYRPVPTVIHFARFEQPFLERLSGGAPGLDIVCTHDIARRLLPELPRRTLRALAGYFGRAVGALRRSADHVEATAFVWCELVRLLEAEDVSTWAALHDWLARPAARRARAVWPMPRDVRLSVPDAPGVYRMLRTSGDVLYVGKAASLHDRVNSYFRHRSGVPERLLEMLSQARALSFQVTPTAVEAALLEPDEIKRHRPPYNIALTDRERNVWFATRDLGTRSRRVSSVYCVGPIAAPELLDEFAALAAGSPAALGSGRWAPDSEVFAAGYERLRRSHTELSSVDPGDARASRDRHRSGAALLRVGTRLWREGRRDRADDSEESATGIDQSWTPESIQLALERLVLRAALARRRAMWLTMLFDAAVTWTERGDVGGRLIVIENGHVTRSGTDEGSEPPIPPAYRRSRAARRAAFTIASYDRLRVLTTELKRLVVTAVPVAVRFAPHRLLTGGRLANALWWL